MTSFAYILPINLNSSANSLYSYVEIPFLGLGRICTSSYLVEFSLGGGGSRMGSTISMVGGILVWVALLN